MRKARVLGAVSSANVLRAKALAMTILLCMTGCGYTLNHRLMESFTRPPGIFVPVFSNSTDETGAERIFTNALIRELQSRGEVVLTTRDRGGLSLQGTLLAISYSPTAYTPNGFKGLQDYRRLPSELGVTASIYLSLVDLKAGRTLWAQRFSGFRRVAAPLTRTYDYQSPSSVGLFTQSLIESQYTDIAEDIMRDVYDEMVELF